MAEWDHPRFMLRHIRGVGYAVVAPGQLNINPRNVPGSIPGAGRVWQLLPSFFLLFPSPPFVRLEACIELERRLGRQSTFEPPSPSRCPGIPFPP